MSDIARLEIVNQFGGYYFDCDFYSWGNDIEKIVNLDHNMGVFSTENLLLHLLEITSIFFVTPHSFFLIPNLYILRFEELF